MNSILTQNIQAIKQICKSHKVKKLYAFGSVCTDKFNEKSDIDFIISFENRYFDNYVENFFELEDELKKLLNRKIDLVTQETIQNPYFIKVVNRTKTPIYE
jgi:predicted nucleotidyltransferase